MQVQYFEDFKDIPWNFLIGDDEMVYEGRGFLYQGEIPSNGTLTNSFENVGLFIAFIGTFTTNSPSSGQILTFNNFIDNSVRRDFLEEEYVLLLQDELVTTEFPSANGIAEAMKEEDGYHKSIFLKVFKTTTILTIWNF